jgi:hypothetical protein
MDRHNSEIYKRRQIHDRINELKIKCEQLRQTKDSLVSKLRELNEAADQLIADKDNVNSQVRADLFGAKFLRSVPYKSHHDLTHDVPQFGSKSATNSLNQFRSKFSSPSSHRNEQETLAPLSGQPSDAFKMKISLCLHEVMEKAEEIAELSDRMSKADTYDEHRKQQKTH